MSKRFLRTGALGASIAVAIVANGDDINVAAWESSWQARALAAQRRLSWNMPFTQNLTLETHNSYNTQDDGYPFFQHSYTMTEQLRLGIRAINLDVHWLDDEQLHLSHATPDHFGASEDDRLYEDGVAEIAAWVHANPDEVIFVEIENQTDGHIAELVSVLEQHLGQPTDRIFRTSDTPLPVDWTAISPATVRAAGKSVVILCSGVPQNCVFSPDGFWNNPWPSNSVHRFHQRYAVGEVWLAGMFKQGVTSFSGDTQCVGVPGTPWYHNGPDDIGVYTNRTVYDMARAGVDMPTIEPFGVSRAYWSCLPGYNYETNVDVLLEGGLWSWAAAPPVNQLPKAAVTSMEDPIGIREYGAYLRSALTWSAYPVAMQNAAGDWVISSQAVTFHEAALHVSQQYPGHSFTCPGNGFEMLRLQIALSTAGIYNAWVNYSDIDGVNQWTAVTQPRTNLWPSPLCPDEPLRRVGFEYDTVSEAIADSNGSCNHLVIDGGDYQENPVFDRPMEVWVYYGVTIGTP